MSEARRRKWRVDTRAGMGGSGIRDALRKAVRYVGEIESEYRSSSVVIICLIVSGGMFVVLLLLVVGGGIGFDAIFSNGFQFPFRSPWSDRTFPDFARLVRGLVLFKS